MQSICLYIILYLIYLYFKEILLHYILPSKSIAFVFYKVGSTIVSTWYTLSVCLAYAQDILTNKPFNYRNIFSLGACMCLAYALHIQRIWLLRKIMATDAPTFFQWLHR